MPLLELPAELRELIYRYVVFDDLNRFLSFHRRPALLYVCRQSRSEYSDLLLGRLGGRSGSETGQALFGNEIVVIQRYYEETGTWCKVDGVVQKLSILEHCACDHSYKMGSLASAQRQCASMITLRNRTNGRGVLVVNQFNGPTWCVWTL